MEIYGAYENSPLNWSLEYTTTPVSGSHLVQFKYEAIEPENPSLGKLTLRLEGLPDAFYWRWKVVSMDQGAGSRVEVASARSKRQLIAKDPDSPNSAVGNPSTNPSVMI